MAVKTASAVLEGGDLRFVGRLGSGHSLVLDDAKGDTGVRPAELIPLELAGCTGMDVISILGKKRQDVTSFDVQVHADRATEQPHVFTHAVIEYSVTGHNVDEKAVVRSIELSATRYCPAIAMLSKAMPIDFKYRVFEDQAGGKRTQVKTGSFVPQVVAPS